MRSGSSARKIITQRMNYAWAEAKRVRAETWDGAFWLLPAWSTLPVVDRLGHLCEMLYHAPRDAFIARLCRQHGTRWVADRDNLTAWMSQCTFLCGEYLLTVIHDEDMWSTFEERYPASVDDILRAVNAWRAKRGEVVTVADRNEAT